MEDFTVRGHHVRSSKERHKARSWGFELDVPFNTLAHLGRFRSMSSHPLLRSHLADLNSGSLSQAHLICGLHSTLTPKSEVSPYGSRHCPTAVLPRHHDQEKSLLALQLYLHAHASIPTGHVSKQKNAGLVGPPLLHCNECTVLYNAVVRSSIFASYYLCRHKSSEPDLSSGYLLTVEC